MKLRWICLPCAILAVFLIISRSSRAVDQRPINEVLTKQVLTKEDLQVIDTFLGEAIQELLRTRDFTTVAQLRAVILSKHGKQPQYVQQYSESARRHLQAGIQKALALPEDRQAKVLANLLIIIDQLQDMAMADLAIGVLGHKNMMVRYWAVHSLTNPTIVAKLKAGGEAGLRTARVVGEQFKGLVGTSAPEVLALMAGFAGSLDLTQTNDLLLQVADARIQQYNSWSVKYELAEIAVLKALSDKIGSAGSNRPALAQRFGQLLSCAVQRYIKGKDILIDTQKRQVASVIVETEAKCLAKLLGDTASTSFRRALERDDYAGLSAEHNRLLGDANQAGQLAAKLNFNFGKDPRGRDRLSPVSLPDPPAKSATGN